MSTEQINQLGRQFSDVLNVDIETPEICGFRYKRGHIAWLWYVLSLCAMHRTASDIAWEVKASSSCCRIQLPTDDECPRAAVYTRLDMGMELCIHGDFRLSPPVARYLFPESMWKHTGSSSILEFQVRHRTPYALDLWAGLEGLRQLQYGCRSMPYRGMWGIRHFLIPHSIPLTPTHKFYQIPGHTPA